MVKKRNSTLRKKAFERDNFTCQKCDDGNGGNLNAHHIKPFHKIIEEFLTHLIKCYEHLYTGTLAELQLPINDWKKLTIKTQAHFIRGWHPKKT